MGEHYILFFETLRVQHQHQENIMDAATQLLNVASACLPGMGTQGAQAVLSTARIHQEHGNQMMAQLARRYLMRGLRHYLHARDLCPTRPETHLEIASYVEFLNKSDSRRVYVERALYLEPTHPELWYRVGTLAVRDGQPEQAWKDWRRSLELSDRYLQPVLERSKAHLAPEELIRRVLPDRPRILVAAAIHLYPDIDATERQPFLARAKVLYDTLPGPWEADDMHQKALVLYGLGHSKEAQAAYREALLRKPQQLDWRYELAGLLFQQQRFRDARQELHTILALQPKHAPAQTLLARVEHEIAKVRY
jgi:tetratricopeptide (TPR) repeat protein